LAPALALGKICKKQSTAALNSGSFGVGTNKNEKQGLLLLKNCFFKFFGFFFNILNVFIVLFPIYSFFFFYFFNVGIILRNLI